MHTAVVVGGSRTLQRLPPLRAAIWLAILPFRIFWDAALIAHVAGAAQHRAVFSHETSNHNVVALAGVLCLARWGVESAVADWRGGGDGGFGGGGFSFGGFSSGGGSARMWPRIVRVPTGENIHQCLDPVGAIVFRAPSDLERLGGKDGY